MVFRAFPEALLLCIAALHQPSTAAASLQTEWQKALFKNVSERAAQLSEAAVPALLARLDSAAFREELAKCCPSVCRLSAQKLLERLREEVKVAEITSGFPGVMDTEDIFPDFPVMSIADGLRGSFFPNSWQGVFLDAKDPAKIFNTGMARYLTVVHHQGEDKVRVDQWAGAGCHGKHVMSGSFPLNQCVRNEQKGVVMKYTANSTSVNETLWFTSTVAWERRAFRFQSMSAVACPTEPPLLVSSFEADGLCHSYDIGWNDGWKMEDNAEMASYGLKPFATLGVPKSLQEASERGPYALVNQFLFDQGSPLFGDVSAVFSIKAMQDTALISAIDTGFYQSVCKGTRHGHGSSFLEKLSHNCSVYTPFHLLGTTQHFNHLFLINDNFWTTSPSPLAQRFARLEGEWGSRPFPGYDMLRYWEAVPVATLQYPSDVRFLIGSFTAFFGSPTGTSLQRWAKQRRWVLMWSLGPNIGLNTNFFIELIKTNQTLAMNQRLLDPDVVQSTTAAEALDLGEGVLRQFRRSWAEVEKLRQTSSSISHDVWAEQWHRLVDPLPRKLRMRPLATGLCSRPQDAPECVGVNGDGHCVCYARGASLPSSAELVV